MADIFDVADSLVARIASIVYPNGTGQPSIVNFPLILYSGWPTSSKLDDDLKLPKPHITVYPRPETKNVTRYAPKQQVMSIAAATLTLTAHGNVVTVGGAMPSPFTAHNLALIVDSQPFIYPVQASDTLTTIATGLATLLAVSFPGTTSSGPVITLPANTVPIIARVGTTGVVTTEWERQTQRYQVTVWAQDPPTRKALGAAIRAAFSQIAFITMVDGFGARVTFQGNVPSDNFQKEKLYRYDLLYDVEYATTVTQTLATVVATKVTFETQSGVPIITRTY